MLVLLNDNLSTVQDENNSKSLIRKNVKGNGHSILRCYQRISVDILKQKHEIMHREQPTSDVLAVKVKFPRCMSSRPFETKKVKASRFSRLSAP
jgi:hypothetical protein